MKLRKRDIYRDAHMTYAEAAQHTHPVSAVVSRQISGLSEFWQHPAVSVILPLLMAALDFFVLKTIMDRAIIQSETMAFIMGFGIALTLNLLPSYIVKQHFDEVYGRSVVAKRNVYLGITAFTLLYLGVTLARFAYYDMFLPDGSGLVNTIGETAGQADVPNIDYIKALAITLLTSVEPLATSALCAIHAYYTGDPEKAELQYYEVRREEILTELRRVNLALVSYERSEEELQDLDSERYRAACEAIHFRCAALHARGLQMLEEYLASPEATTKISATATQMANEATKQISFAESPSNGTDETVQKGVTDESQILLSA